MIDSQQDVLFGEASRSVSLKLIAAIAALVVTAVVLTGYMLLRRKHAQNTAQLAPAVEAHKPPKALVMVDEALLKGGNTILGGTVKNTSVEKLDGLGVELELKRRNDGSTETQLVALQPMQLEPQQEGRYSVQLRAQDYSYARLVGLKSGSNIVPYSTAPGQKRPLERLDTKTITIGKPSGGKPGEFLNSPDNPARVP
jgi:hypothetical protein